MVFDCQHPGCIFSTLFEAGAGHHSATTGHFVMEVMRNPAEKANIRGTVNSVQ